MGFTRDNIGEAYDAICEALTLVEEAQGHTNLCWAKPVHIGPDVLLAVAVTRAVTQLYLARGIIERGMETIEPICVDCSWYDEDAGCRLGRISSNPDTAAIVVCPEFTMETP